MTNRRRAYAKSLKSIAEALEDKTDELGKNPEDVFLVMHSRCDCVAGFLGDGSYSGGMWAIQQVLEDDVDVIDIENALLQAGIITQNGFDFGMTGVNGEFYGTPDTKIPLTRVLSKLHEYADNL